MFAVPSVRPLRIRSRGEMTATVNGIKVDVPAGTTILEAARAAGFLIPTLCYLKGLNEVGACRVCVVEVKGCDRLVPACSTPMSEGMEIETNSERVRSARLNTVQLILSNHRGTCPTCERNGSCQLQALAKAMNLSEPSPYPAKVARDGWDKSLPLVRTDSRCVSCLRCVNVCEKTQGLKVWDLVGFGDRARVALCGDKQFSESGCTLCGECIEQCPVSALNPRDDTSRFRALLGDSSKRVVVCVDSSCADADRARVTTALRALGVKELVETLPATRSANAVFVTVMAPLKLKGACDRAAAGDLALTPRETDGLLRLYGSQLKN